MACIYKFLKNRLRRMQNIKYIIEVHSSYNHHIKALLLLIVYELMGPEWRSCCNLFRYLVLTADEHARHEICPDRLMLPGSVQATENGS